MRSPDPSQPLALEDLLLLSLIGEREDLLGGLPLHDASRKADWDGLLAAATSPLHPYLGHRVKSLNLGESIPPESAERLAAARRANAAMGLERRRELDTVLRALDENAIQVLVLKGIVLAHDTYPDPSLRPMMDIDLLIPRGRWDQAREALERTGLQIPERHRYRPLVGHDGIPQEEKPLQRPGTRIMVELHTALEFGEAAGRVDLTAIWPRTRDVSLSGIVAKTLCPEDFLIHLCHHLSSHHLFDKGLLPLVDIHLYVTRRAAEWDWAALAATTLLHGGAEWVYLTLALARDLLGSPVPESFFAKVPPPRRLEEVASLAAEQLLLAGRNPISPGLARLASESALKRALRLGRRINPWRREEAAAGPGGAPGGVVHAAVTASRRLVVDIKTRARIFSSVRKRGELTRKNVELAVRLQEGRDRIVQIMTGRSARAAALATTNPRR